MGRDIIKANKPYPMSFFMRPITAKSYKGKSACLRPGWI